MNRNASATLVGILVSTLLTSGATFCVAQSPNADSFNGYQLDDRDTAVNAGSVRDGCSTKVEGAGRSEGSPVNFGVNESPIAAVPNAPSDLVATVMSSSRVDLVWVDNSADEDGFLVYRSDGDEFNLLQTLGSDSSSFMDGQLTPCAEVSYFVVAFNNDGESSQSNTADATTSEALPGLPEFLEATVAGPTEVDLLWSNGWVYQTAVEIERAEENGPFVALAALVGLARSYKDTTAEPATTYTYRVRGVNTCGASDWGTTATATTPEDTSAPLNPTFEWSPTTATVGQLVSFTGSSTGTPTTWAWDFGDGTTGTGQKIDHSFDITGALTVELTVSRGEESASVSREILVLDIDPIVAATAHKKGKKGTFWTTNMVMVNNNPKSAVGRILFFRSAQPAGAVIHFSIKPHFMMTYEDIVGQLLHQETGAVAIELEEGSPAPQIMARTFTPGPSGTYGHAAPGEAPLQSGTYHLTGLRGGPAFRSNFGVAVSQKASATVQLTLHLPNESLVGPALVRPPGSMAQWGIEDIWGSPVLSGIEAATLEVKLIGEAVIYIAVVDEQSGDPVYVSGVQPSATWQIPLVGQGAGKRGTYWDTDIVLYNPNEQASTVDMEWLRADADNRSGNPMTGVTLAPHETYLIEHAPQTLWGITSKENGSVMISATQQVVIEARTWTPVPEGLPGTMGQRVIPIDLSNPRPIPTTLPWAREDDQVRTNVGFVNRSNAMVTLQLRLYKSAGSVQRVGTINLAPRSVSQRSLTNLFGSNPLGQGQNGWVEVIGATRDQEVFASMVANDSGDPVFIPGT
jgi:PKD repeat protein